MVCPKKPHIVILGAGVGGVSAAYELRKRTEENGVACHITVISPSSKFHFIPSNPYVGTGQKTRKDIEVDLRKPFARENIRLLVTSAEEIQPERNRIRTAAGDVVPYDYLIIATGPAHDWEAVPGMEDYTHSICSPPEAEKAYVALQKFYKKPGPVVVGIAPGASCAGPGYEQLFILEEALRRQGLAEEKLITFFTAEPDLGNFGIGGISNSRAAFEQEMAKRNIRWISNAEATAFEQGPDGTCLVRLSEFDQDGNVFQKHVLPYRYGIMVPRFKGVKPLLDQRLVANGLVNKEGFVFVDEHQANPVFSNIFGTGICTAKPRAVSSVIPVGVPTTGRHIESMSEAAAENIISDMKGEERRHVATGNVCCLMGAGRTAFAAVAGPVYPPHKVAQFRSGPEICMAKEGFAQYYEQKVRNWRALSTVEEKLGNWVGFHTISDQSQCHEGHISRRLRTPGLV